MLVYDIFKGQENAGLERIRRMLERDLFRTRFAAIHVL